MAFIKNLLFLALIFFFPLVAFGQDKEEFNEDEGDEYYEDEYYEDDYRPRKLSIIDIMFEIGDPQRAFGDRLNDTGYGLNLSMLFQLKLDKPGFLGFDIYGYHMDKERDIIIDFINGNSVELERKLNNWITGTNLVYRHFPSFNIPVIEPYFEALVGGKWIFSTFQTTDLYDDSSVEFDFIESSFSISYGFSLGLQAYISNQYYLNFRTTYLPGNSVSYLARNPDADASNTSNPRDYFDLTSSATDLIRYQMGLSILIQ